jgi:hypothetical protein
MRPQRRRRPLHLTPKKLRVPSKTPLLSVERKDTMILGQMLGAEQEQCAWPSKCESFMGAPTAIVGISPATSI